MTHHIVSGLLYEYVRMELDDKTRNSVREHLVLCPECRLRTEEIREILLHIPDGEKAPAEVRSDEEWGIIRDSIMGRIAASHRVRGIGSRIPDISWKRWWPAAAAVSAAVFFAVLFTGGDEAVPESTPLITEVPSESQAMKQYLSQSRSLLVGLTNMDLSEDTMVDLSAERALSRDLFHRGRSIQQQPIDPYSQQLITDLGAVMEQVAGSSGQERAADIESIRNTIQGRRLLIKVRMAEAGYHLPPVTRTLNRH